MKPLDKHYLSLQFRISIYSKNGTEFQSFFENIMEKAFPDYQKIKPYGGDGGNDGYIKKLGIYYQVYAPQVPQIKEAEAAKKLKKDFSEKLKNNWDKISEIKEYNFVFNDKYSGSTQLLEQTISDLKAENKGIEFKLFLAKNLENVFFQLDESNILDLGFNIDEIQAISNARIYLDNVKTELDRENTLFAQKILEYSKDIIYKLNNEELSLEYEILECRCLQKLENAAGAKEKYESISKRFPKDPRAFLYLAEIYLNDGNFDENEKLLEKAREIDDTYWLLKIEELVRKHHLGEKVNIATIDEKTFPNNPNIKANFYRLYAMFFEESGDKTNADSFIAKAIYLNPNRLNNYIVKLSFIEGRLFAGQDTLLMVQESQKLLEEIEQVENKFFEYGDIGARNRVILNIKKLNVFHVQENFQELEKIAKESFKLCLTCNFDRNIDQILAVLLMYVLFPENDFEQSLEYLENSKKEISEKLLISLIFQFNISDSLFTKGVKFFRDIKNQKYVDFISYIRNKDYEKVLKFLENNTHLAVVIANTLKKFPDLRRKIIENLPNDKNIQKDKLLLYFNFDEKNFDEAFKILKEIDLTNLNYFECKTVLGILREKKAWDSEIIVLGKLLQKEKNKEEIFNLELQLFDAYFNLKKYPEAISLGEKLLNKDSIEKKLDSRYKEALLTNTILACFERGKLDNDAFKKSLTILKEYQLSQPSFVFKVGIEAPVYLNNNNARKALESVIEGVKSKKVLSPEEYAKLYFILALKIGKEINLNLNSLRKVKENTFVKLKDKDQWYFVGNDNELDAIKISKGKNKYSLFIDKKARDNIVFTSEYDSKSSKETIEKIFPIEKYILHKSIHYFQNLSKDDVLDGVHMIEVPEKERTIDTRFLSKFFEDEYKKTEQFFETYCKNNVPLAALAANEGGLENAIAHIQRENRGFINFSTGTEEFEKQKGIAKSIVDKKMQFYIDGTSALVLSGIGLLKTVYTYLPNLKVPQSVINLLVNLSERFRYIPGQAGKMGYIQGRIVFYPVEKDKTDLIRTNFLESIKLLESKPENICVISSANKMDCVSEQKIPAELSDACVLAQKQKLPILTEDFLYLKMNELETKKKSPEYFSSLALVRVLYEKKWISFDEYLKFFNYLSLYRFRFLSLSTDDIEKTVLGDGKIKVVSSENIRKLNFPLTLSEEYGVPFQTAFKVVGGFLFRILMDNSVTPDITEKIFVEVIETFPTEMNKEEFVQLLLAVCRKLIKNNKPKFIFCLKNKMIEEKINRLFQLTKVFNSETKLWIPTKTGDRPFNN